MVTERVQNPKPRRTVSRPPEWIRRAWAKDGGVDATRGVLRGLGLHTVCESARCPNRGECWQRRTATFMVLGDVCTRGCRFCGVTKGVPAEVDAAEPRNVAEAVARLGLAHAVITSVTRDDLQDGGAAHISATIKAIRTRCPESRIEALVPDFTGDATALETVFAAEPDIFAHNLEMAARLYPELRSARHSYERSLEVLRVAANHAARHGGRPVVKSSLMAGLGETDAEVEETLRDLRGAGCATVAIGQYLRPSPVQFEVARFVEPERFREYERVALELGFTYAVAGPFVRSSYHSDELWKALEHGAR